jgi:CRP-like cAMP-binding protein
VLRKDAKIELIRKVPLFSQCSKKDLASIATLADLVDVPAGRKLVTEGARAREFMIIVSGSVEVRRGEKKIATLGPGEFFGEIALVVGGPRTASVSTTSPTSLLVVTDGAFTMLLDDTPSLQIKVLKALAERLRPAAV